MGYHKSEIKKGVFGEISKIQEELYELEDAVAQNCKIMAACELADMIGAIRAYAKTLNLDLNDLVSMADRTESAFLDGSRTAKPVTYVMTSRRDGSQLTGGLDCGEYDSPEACERAIRRLPSWADKSIWMPGVKRQ